MQPFHCHNELQENFHPRPIDRISIRDKSIHIVIQDIKQPLTHIMLSAESLQQDHMDEETRLRLLKIIAESSKKIESSIRDLCWFLEHGYNSPENDIL